MRPSSKVIGGNPNNFTGHVSAGNGKQRMSDLAKGRETGRRMSEWWRLCLWVSVLLMLVEVRGGVVDELRRAGRNDSVATELGQTMERWALELKWCRIQLTAATYGLDVGNLVPIHTY